MGSGKHRWKLSFHRSPSSAPSSPMSPANSAGGGDAAAPPPSEFVCPISGELMADPVILPSGHTFERACIEACADLARAPPALSSPLPRPLLLIPNAALRCAILRWCDHSGHPGPVPVAPAAARDLARRLAPATKEDGCGGGGQDSSGSPDTPPLTVPAKAQSCYSLPSSSPSSNFSSSSYSSIEIAAVGSDEAQIPSATDSPAPVSMADEILMRLRDPRMSEQEAALAALRGATRESRDRRAALCTPRLLAALRPLLLSRHAGVQANAVASLVNLSLEAVNKVPIVRSGAVPALVGALTCGHAEARDHAAGALFSLALDEENRAAVGVLGALPPLLHLFARSAESPRARRDAGTALYHLSLSGTNRSKLARAPGAVRALLGVAAEGAGLARIALMVLCNVAGSGEGRAAMMDAGAVAGVAALMKGGQLGAEERACCLAALYGMSRRSLRFRGLARAAGAEEAVAAAAEDESLSEAAREMAWMTLRATRGEEDDDFEISASEGSIVSDGVLSLRRRYRDFAGVSDVNSAEF